MLTAGTILQGRYRVVGLLGQGGMGAVYEAVDYRLSRAVALKEMLVTEDELKRAFEREARLLANLHHPSLPRVTDHFTEGQEQYLVMDFIPGPDLKDLIGRRGGPFPAPDVLRWAGELLDALEYLHGHDPPVIHRDIKPANLKLAAKGTIVLLDFGLAKGRAGLMPLPAESLSVPGYTPHYAALEQIQGERTGVRSDLYSLAATLYHLLTGVVPPDALKRATDVISGFAAPLVPANQVAPGVPPRVADALRRAMSLNPQARPASAAEFRELLFDSALGTASGPQKPGSPDIKDELQMSPRGDVRKDEITRVGHTPGTGYQLPDVALLNAPPPHHELADEELLISATRLAEKLKEFNVTGQIKHITPGPVVTIYEFKPDPGVRYADVAGLADDLCMALRADSVRVERLPGKPHIGIEVSNPERDIVFLREVVESRVFHESPSKLTIALGQMADGLNYVADLATLPHFLIAGATGSGKSVCVNSLIVSILYKAQPDEVKFILIDPKRLELGLYEDIPHLATPVITGAAQASLALRWAAAEMDRRYKELAGWGVRDLAGFNAEVSRRNLAGDFDETGKAWEPLPYVVIIIDEIADLVDSECDVIEPITRLAQMGRAAGIHLIIATQRPSVDIVSGLIKANLGARISFKVTSKADSRIIFDAGGAERLLGRGDMMFRPPGSSSAVRVHGAYVGEDEVGRVVRHVKTQGEPVYANPIISTEEDLLDDFRGEERDELFEDALRICVEMRRASTSVLQRRLRIGFGRAAAILDLMEREGFIGQADGARPRPVLSRAFETVAEWDDPKW
jgi:DNA segregation ATPase FtsK/SpoIIIE, S-DNA-T family